jgi:hypothetical protein
MSTPFVQRYGEIQVTGYLSLRFAKGWSCIRLRAEEIGADGARIDVSLTPENAKELIASLEVALAECAEKR